MTHRLVSCGTRLAVSLIVTQQNTVTLETLKTSPYLTGNTSLQRPDGECYLGKLMSVYYEKRGPLTLVSTIEELLGRKSSGSSLGNRDYCRRGSAALTT
jgi:hypothetical protein